MVAVVTRRTTRGLPRPSPGSTMSRPLIRDPSTTHAPPRPPPRSRRHLTHALGPCRTSTGGCLTLALQRPLPTSSAARTQGYEEAQATTVPYQRRIRTEAAPPVGTQ